MRSNKLDSLTPSERTVLRELLQERDQKTVARSLGLSPETVKTHLRNAREKCGADSSFALAKAFALYEGAPPGRGIPSDGGGASAASDVKEGASEAGEALNDRSDELREARTPFVFEQEFLTRSTAEPLQERAGHVGVQRLLMIAALVLFLVFAIILAFPLSESFQRFANLIQPPIG